MATENMNYGDTISDYLTGTILKTTPEEIVRQTFIRTLHEDYLYPKEIIRREVSIQSGSKILQDETGADIRADIVVYHNKRAALDGDQGNILFVVECKKPNVTDGYNQLVSYVFNTSAVGAVWTNGNQINIYRKTKEIGRLEEIQSLPLYRELWQSEHDAIPQKEELKRPHNIRFLLATCHNKLYGRGMENEDFDLAMDMVRILLAKIQDETGPGLYPRFWITDENFKTVEGRAAVASTIQTLFREYADQYPDIFDAHEKISVGNDCIAEAVGILQKWNLAACNDDADDWDLMGETYEQFTHINLKRQQGQFFTNRLVVNMMVKMLAPEIGDRILDPAGGGGGFATAMFRYLRRKVIMSTKHGSAARDRQLTTIKDSIYLVEIAARLVKIAKCAMLLTGDGQTGMTRGNSIDQYDRLDPWIKSRCFANTTNAPSIIVTNPPFSGQKADSQISDRNILRNFKFGHTYTQQQDGSYIFSESDNDLLSRQSPELLFLERCIDWLKPGGRLGIVLPKGVLDNITCEAYRSWLLDNCNIKAIITLHKDTFQPDTGVRTCVLILEKYSKGHKGINNDRIFMAQSQRIGQDSKGNAVYVVDNNGSSTGVLSQDLDEIAEAYSSFLQDNTAIHPSEYIFSIHRNDLKDHLNLNPQHYSPRLNRAIDHVLEYNEKPGWSVTTIGQLEAGMKIFMGPRWNSATIKVDNPTNTAELTPYLTANGALELRRFTVKWLDFSKATRQQRECRSLLKIKEGDILITRSGTIGKVTYATKNLAMTYLVSDDLIRIRVQDKTLRAYLLTYFSSSMARSLMLLDEYGSVQQHLQPRHIQEMLIPIPEDWESATQEIAAGNRLIHAMENLSLADHLIQNSIFNIF